MARLGSSKNFDQMKAKMRSEIYSYREQLLGVGHPDVLKWAAPYPASRPESGRVRFCQIWALGGPIPMQAAEHELYCVPARVRSTFIVQHGTAEHTYQLHLWIRPRRSEAVGSQHTQRHCDAELHDGWNTDTWRAKKKRTRRGKVIFRGRIDDCMAHAKMLFQAWEGASRLGGVGDDVVFVG